MQFRFAFICLTFFAVACGDSARSEPTRTRTSTDASGAVQLGSVPAPALDGQESDGSAFSLAELKGDPVVLVFYRGAFCGLCREHLKQLAANSAAYDGADVKVIGVTLDAPDVTRRTREELKLEMPIVTAKPETFRAWGIWQEGERYPHTAAFVLDAEGRVRYGRVATNAESAVSEVELRTIARNVANSQ